MMRSMVFRKFNLLATLAVFVGAVALAYTSGQVKFNVSNPKSFAQIVEKTSGLKMSNLEKTIKSDYIYKKLKHPTDFDKELKDPASPEQIHSFLLEIEEALKEKNVNKDKIKSGAKLYEKLMLNSKIDLAKKIARKQFSDVVETKWHDIKRTMINQNGDKSFAIAKVEIHRRLREEMIFAPRKALSGKYRFDVADWGYVEVDKASVGRGAVYVDVSSFNDINTLEPGIMDLHTEPGPGEDSESVEE
jgi:hypothetical protein